MYRKLLVPTDNSTHSNDAADIAIRISKSCGSTVTGLHVYAAKLHDMRFREMENGLPERYQTEKELQRQRQVHENLISEGLSIISDSYLDALSKRCRSAEVSFSKKSVDGKNYKGILDELESGGYDLVVMGALGLGATEGSLIGSVCERVVRRAEADVLVVRGNRDAHGERILVAVDGSDNSFGGFKRAVGMAKSLGLGLEAASVFDPFFHNAAFRNIAGVLSEKAGKIFKFKEQERLHEEIINGGLAKIYQEHLETCLRMAREEGAEVTTHLLQGKPFEELLRFARRTHPWLLIVGRVGVHDDGSTDIGSTAENLLRLAPCNILISGALHHPRREENREAAAWTEEAEGRLLPMPPFARRMARAAIERYASERGHAVITSDLIDRVMKEIIPSAMRDLMGIPPSSPEENPDPGTES